MEDYITVQLCPTDEELLKCRHRPPDLIISSLPIRDCSQVKNTHYWPMLQQTLSFPVYRGEIALKSRTHIIGQRCSRPYHFQCTKERLLSSQEHTSLANATADLIISNLPRRDCSQVINIQNMHWCVTTNAGCKDGVIKVYDSMYDSLGFQCHRLATHNSHMVDKVTEPF